MNLLPLLPDLILLLTGVAVLLADTRNSAKDTATPLAAGGTLAALAALFATRPEAAAGWTTYAATPQGYWWRLAFFLALLFTQLLARPYFAPENETPAGPRSWLKGPGAFQALLLFCTLGMCALVSARDLLTFFLGLEMATLPLFALAGFRPKAGESVEAAAKLMVMAGLATALNLFGFSFLYGAAGGLGFEQVAAALPGPLLGLGAFLLFGGIGFKLALVPFQMWAPDVYEGAPTPVTAFLSVSSKAAGLAAMAVLFFGPLSALRPAFFVLFAVAALASMIAGNLGAMRQENLRRFLGYSSIAQAGFFLLAFTGDAARGQQALIFNLVVYGAANLAFFFVIGALGPRRPETMASLRGLSAEKPGLALVLLLSMFSLAGIPPLAGFMGKFLLFSSAAGAGHYWLVFAALLSAVWSLFYYLRPVREAYVAGEDALPAAPRAAWIQALPLWALTAAVALLGLWPRWFERIP